MGNSASEQKKLEQDIERVRQEMSAKYKVFLIGEAGIGKVCVSLAVLFHSDSCSVCFSTSCWVTKMRHKSSRRSLMNHLLERV